MGIVDDSVELLTYIYKEYTENDETDISPQDISRNFDWGSDKINRAILFLDDENLIKISFASGTTEEGVRHFNIRGMTPRGIRTIEDEKEFKDKFGVEVGIPGFIKAIWTKEER